MVQCYLLGNVTKCQGKAPTASWQAISIVGNGDFQSELALLLLDFGQNDPELQKKSLENTCLEYLARHSDEYTEGYEQQLPKQLQQKIIMKKMTLLHVGAWAGDHLIITGDYSDYSPFPPDGRWMKNSGDLFGMIDGSFADIPDVLAILKEEKKVALDELTKLCEDKLHFIVNLDLKEYLAHEPTTGEKKMHSSL